MKLIAEILTGIVAAEHFYILWMEMFAWTTVGRKTFKKFPADLFERTKAMAANQGLYNGFLAAGLTWSLFITDPIWSVNVACFFLSCVIIAGIYGAITVDRAILFTQGLPAMVALGAVIIS